MKRQLSIHLSGCTCRVEAGRVVALRSFSGGFIKEQELCGFLFESVEQVVGRVGAARGAAEDEDSDDE